MTQSYVYAVAVHQTGEGGVQSVQVEIKKNRSPLKPYPEIIYNTKSMRGLGSHSYNTSTSILHRTGKTASLAGIHDQ